MIRAIFRFLAKVFYRVSAVVGALFLVLFLVGFLALRQEKGHPPLVDKTVLSLNLEGDYVDHGEPSLLGQLLSGGEKSFADLTSLIRRAASEKKVSALVIQGGVSSLGMAQRQELRDSLLYFRSQGKKVYYYTTSFGELSSGTPDYYVATAADDVWVQPVGSLNLNGLSIEMPFGRGTLDWLGVAPEIAKRMEYKSFPEMYTEKEMTPAAKENFQAVANSLMDQMVDGIAKSRKLENAQVRALIEAAPYSLEAAQKAGLIDHVGYHYALLEKIKTDLGLKTLTPRALETLPDEEKRTGDGVALIFDEGAIMDLGPTTPLGEKDGVSARATYQNILKAVHDDHIKVIVYRLDSPGGSPSASETILSAILYAQSKGKPVVISMGNMAASGAYWVASGADKIVAQPGTLTGSIGVLAGKMVLKGAWEKIELHWDGVKTDPNADMWSPNQNFTPFGWMKLNESLDAIYADFIQRVAKGRKLTAPQVDKVAKGRVWTGEQALALGLVDHMGGLHDALQMAREMKKLDPNAPTYIYPERRSLLEALILFLTGGEEEAEPGVSMGVFSRVGMLWRRVESILSLVLENPEAVQSPPLFVR